MGFLGTSALSLGHKSDRNQMERESQSRPHRPDAPGSCLPPGLAESQRFASETQIPPLNESRSRSAAGVSKDRWPGRVAGWPHLLPARDRPPDQRWVQLVMSKARWFGHLPRGKNRKHVALGHFMKACERGHRPRGQPSAWGRAHAGEGLLQASQLWPRAAEVPPEPDWPSQRPPRDLGQLSWPIN